jgi:hypothetical protein
VFYNPTEDNSYLSTMTIAVYNDSGFDMYYLFFTDNACTVLYDYTYFYKGEKCLDNSLFLTEKVSERYGLIAYSADGSTCPDNLDPSNAYISTVQIPFDTCTRIDSDNYLKLIDCYEENGVIYGKYNRYLTEDCSGKPDAKNKITQLGNSACTSGGGVYHWSACEKSN